MVESWVTFGKVLPGEEVAYSIACTNQGAAPASDVAVSLPIPAEMTLLLPEKVPGVEITYSIDGGKTYAAFERLVIVAPDGASRPARADDIRWVRWKLAAALAPGTTTRVGCHAILK